MDPHVLRELELIHDRVCFALADPKRLIILYYLSQNPLSVGALAAELGLPQTTVSRHLRILRDRSLVEPHRDGTTIIYSLHDTRIIQALDLMRSLVRTQIETEASIVAAPMPDETNPQTGAPS